MHRGWHLGQTALNVGRVESLAPPEVPGEELGESDDVIADRHLGRRRPELRRLNCERAEATDKLYRRGATHGRSQRLRQGQVGARIANATLCKQVEPRTQHLGRLLSACRLDGVANLPVAEDRLRVTGEHGVGFPMGELLLVADKDLDGIAEVRLGHDLRPRAEAARRHASVAHGRAGHRVGRLPAGSLLRLDGERGVFVVSREIDPVEFAEDGVEGLVFPRVLIGEVVHHRQRLGREVLFDLSDEGFVVGPGRNDLPVFITLAPHVPLPVLLPPHQQGGDAFKFGHLAACLGLEGGL